MIIQSYARKTSNTNDIAFTINKEDLQKTTEILERDYGIIDNDPKEEMRFIVGKCHPVVLVPGMLSTKLQVRINCANLFSEEFEIYKKIK